MLRMCAVAAVVVGSLVAVDHWEAPRYVHALLTHDIGTPDTTSAPLPIASDEPPQVRLAVAGDVGTGDVAAWATAAVVDRYETEREYDALVLLGDNVYPDGDPDEVDRTVFEPFADVLDGSTRMLAVLGNHDVRDGNATAQAAALGMPGRWYATHLDGVLVVSLDSTLADDPAQLAWLESTLAEAEAEWIVATMHHPMYSAGWHGSSVDVRARFEPIFEAYGVDLVLAGHDHDYQRSVPLDGISYVVSGGAAKLRRTDRADFTAVSWSTHHFVDLLVWPDRIEGRAVDHDGRVFDTFTLRTHRGDR